MYVDPIVTKPIVIKAASQSEVPRNVDPNQARSPETKEAFQNFVGETFFSQMLSAMRKTVRKPAYFHGGRAEEAFQGQLDQVLAEELSKASADSFSGPMYELFCLQPQK
jgi:hypothetical protein